MLVTASSVGAVTTDADSLDWLSKFRVLSAVINPLFGFALCIVINKGFNISSRYNHVLHQKMRRLRYKLCGPPARKRVKVRNSYREEKEEKSAVLAFCSGILTFFEQLFQLVVFAPWALSVWVPMDTFRAEVKSTKGLVLISISYMFFLLFPSIAMFMILPNVYQAIDMLVDRDVNLQGAEDQLNIALAVVYCFLCYVLLSTFKRTVAGRDFETRKQQIRLAVMFTVCVGIFVVPLAMVYYVLDPVVVGFIQDPTRADGINTDDVKHYVGTCFVLVYLIGMFVVVGFTMWLSRKKTELNYIVDPHSHVVANLHNLQKMVMQLVEGLQLSSLLLTHTAFVGAGFFKRNSGSSSGASLGIDTDLDTDIDRDAVAVDFSFLKSLLFDFSYFEEYVEDLKKLQSQAYDLKLGGSVIAIIIWVLLIMVPIAIDNIRLERSPLFIKLYSRLTFVQELLAGPMFLVILQTFLSTVDCTLDPEGSGKTVVELKPTQECWTGDHLMYATVGLTGLMAYVPLACLTMVEHVNQEMHFRYVSTANACACNTLMHLTIPVKTACATDAPVPSYGGDCKGLHGSGDSVYKFN
eukprot:COSAG05_NODE_15_length_36348_cov_78.369307_6_plen_579_part_00